MNLPTLPEFDARTARSWANISLFHLIGNIRTIQEYIGQSAGLLAVVKADAYGHGAVPIARACAAAGVQHIGVATLDEADELRKSGVSTDLYVMPPFLPEEAERAIRLDVIPFVSSLEQFMAMQKAARKAPLPTRCFLAVDSGMGREGCLYGEAQEIYERATNQSALRVTGIATHLACADEEYGEAPTIEQIDSFYRFLRSLNTETFASADDGRGNHGLILTICNSPGTIRFALPPPPCGVRQVLYRAGLLLYGIEPYPGAFIPHSNLVPVLSWHARVTLVKQMPAGSLVGYGHTYTLSRPSKVATLAVGYADGLSRRLSNRGSVIIRGQRFPIIGRVSMDQCQIDVTDAHDNIIVGDIIVGDIATLIGTDDKEAQTASDLARIIETTPHEPTCDLSRRVRRLYSHSVPLTVAPSPPSQDSRP